MSDNTPTLPNPYNPSPEPDRGIVLPSDWTDQPGITIPLAAEEKP